MNKKKPLWRREMTKEEMGYHNFISDLPRFLKMLAQEQKERITLCYGVFVVTYTPNDDLIHTRTQDRFTEEGKKIEDKVKSILAGHFQRSKK